MTTPSDAFDAASGRTPHDGTPDEDALRRARRILALRRRDLASEGCPPAARARATGLFATARPSTWLEHARCLFDSWLEAAPATRGTSAPRLVRLVQGDVRIDLEIAPASAQSLAVQAAIEGAPPTAELFLIVDEVEVPIPVTLDENGTGLAWVPENSRLLEVEIFDGAHALLFSEPLSLDPGS